MLCGPRCKCSGLLTQPIPHPFANAKQILERMNTYADLASNLFSKLVAKMSCLVTCILLSLQNWSSFTLLISQILSRCDPLLYFALGWQNPFQTLYALKHQKQPVGTGFYWCTLCFLLYVLSKYVPHGQPWMEVN
jgi:hypothetical protein